MALPIEAALEAAEAATTSPGDAAALQAAREAARRSHCSNNLKQLGLAVHAYRASFNHLPININNWCSPELGTSSKNGKSWIELANNT